MPTRPHAATISEMQTTPAVEAMSELEFMEYTLDQILTGQRQPLVELTAEALEAIEEEHIGAHVSQYPFLY